MAARLAGTGVMAMTADSTLGRGQKTLGGRTRTIEQSASAWTTTESDP